MGEAMVRKFLEDFLPGRFGVTSGYLISQGMPASAPLLHYDVIIYDRIDSPVLWAYGTPDNSQAGNRRAIPVEYVHGLLEVKSRLTKASCSEAAKKLQEVDPLLGGQNSSSEPYPVYLHRDFWRGAVFLDLMSADANKGDLLDAMLPLLGARGFYGVYVARGEGQDEDSSGRIQLLRSDRPFATSFIQDQQTFLHGGTYPQSMQNGFGQRHESLWVDWSKDSFVRFFFGMLQMMQGQIGVRAIPTLHGMTGGQISQPIPPAFLDEGNAVPPVAVATTPV